MIVKGAVKHHPVAPHIARGESFRVDPMDRLGFDAKRLNQIVVRKKPHDCSMMITSATEFEIGYRAIAAPPENDPIVGIHYLQVAHPAMHDAAEHQPVVAFFPMVAGILGQRKLNRDSFNSNFRDEWRGRSNMNITDSGIES